MKDQWFCRRRELDAGILNLKDGRHCCRSQQARGRGIQSSHFDTLACYKTHMKQ